MSGLISPAFDVVDVRGASVIVVLGAGAVVPERDAVEQPPANNANAQSTTAIRLIASLVLSRYWESGARGYVMQADFLTNPAYSQTTGHALPAPGVHAALLRQLWGPLTLVVMPAQSLPLPGYQMDLCVDTQR